MRLWIVLLVVLIANFADTLVIKRPTDDDATPSRNSRGPLTQLSRIMDPVNAEADVETNGVAETTALNSVDLPSAEEQQVDDDENEGAVQNGAVVDEEEALVERNEEEFGEETVTPTVKTGQEITDADIVASAQKEQETSTPAVEIEEDGGITDAEIQESIQGEDNEPELERVGADIEEEAEDPVNATDEIEKSTDPSEELPKHDSDKSSEENTETSDTTGQGEVSATSNYVTNEDATVDAAVEQLFVDHIETTTPLVYVEEGMTNVDIEGFAKEENNEPVLENVEAEIKEQTIDPVNITDDIDQPIGEDSSEVIGESSDSTIASDLPNGDAEAAAEQLFGQTLDPRKFDEENDLE